MNKVFSATPDQVAFLRKQLGDAGVVVPNENSGQIVDNQHGITMNFEYDGVANLSITILRKPWYAPASMIWDELQSHLA